MSRWILFDPIFWQSALRDIPPFDDARLDRRILAIAIESDLSTEKIRHRMECYLHARIAERYGKVHPGTETVN